MMLQALDAKVRAFAYSTRIAVMDEGMLEKRIDDSMEQMMHDTVTYTRSENFSTYRITNNETAVGTGRVGL